MAELVQATLVIPEIGLEHRVLSAFTDTESAVPHFTLDAVGADGYALHVEQLLGAERTVVREDLLANSPSGIPALQLCVRSTSRMR